MAGAAQRAAHGRRDVLGRDNAAGVRTAHRSHRVPLRGENDKSEKEVKCWQSLQLQLASRPARRADRVPLREHTGAALAQSACTHRPHMHQGLSLPHTQVF